jgi:pimeloyl-ACP methyl ester carboxylesterase
VAAERIHRAVSDDGTEIAGRVHGQGPPLVFLHGRLEDGDSCWRELLPYVSDRFTCFLPSTRGRGLSGDHPDHTAERLVEDVTAFVDSIGEPVGIVGWSAGAGLGLGAAACTAATSALAVYEPSVSEVIGEEDGARMRAKLTSMMELAEQTRLAEAARTFLEVVANDEELAALPEDVFRNSGRYVPVALQEVRQTHVPQPGTPRSVTDAAVLGRISAPVLVLHGSRTPVRWIADGARHVAAHVPGAQLREVAGVGHLAPIVQPEPFAEELIRFFPA